MAGSALALNPMTWLADLNETAQGRTSALGKLSNDVNKFGRDISGDTARSAADKAKLDQEAYQTGVEKKLYDKTVLDAATLDMQKKRQAQKSSQLKAGGRAGTILTSGLPQSSQVAAGQKVLLGE